MFSNCFLSLHVAMSHLIIICSHLFTGCSFNKVQRLRISWRRRPRCTGNSTDLLKTSHLPALSHLNCRLHGQNPLERFPSSNSSNLPTGIEVYSWNRFPHPRTYGVLGRISWWLLWVLLVPLLMDSSNLHSPSSLERWLTHSIALYLVFFSFLN
jgi:hypothetical protein